MIFFFVEKKNVKKYDSIVLSACRKDSYLSSADRSLRVTVDRVTD